MAQVSWRTGQVIAGQKEDGAIRNVRVDDDGQFTIGGVVEGSLSRTNDEVRAYPARLTWTNGTDTAVDTTADQLLAANASREALTINHRSGTADAFIGLTGVTATSYIWRLQPGEVLYWTQGVPTAAIFAITSSGTCNLTAAQVGPPTPTPPEEQTPSPQVTSVQVRPLPSRS